MNAKDQTVLLKSKPRKDQKMRSRQALKEEMVLGVVYGKHLKENISVIFSRFALRKVLDKTGGEGTLIKLEIEGEKEARDVIIQEVQSQIYSGRIIHVDFLAVNVNEEVEVEVPITLEGVAPAVKDLGGILIQSLENVEVRCKAKDIPKAIVVDVSVLVSFETMIALKDVKLPAGIEVLSNPEVIVAMVDEPRTDKEMENLDQSAGADVKAVEGVEKKEEPAKEEKKETK